MSSISSYKGTTPFSTTDTMAKIVLDSNSVNMPVSDIVKAGDYTFTFYVKSDSTHYLKAVKVLDPSDYSKSDAIIKTVQCNTSWQEVSFTFNASVVPCSISFVFDKGTYYIYHAKLENGNKATAYSKAESDDTEYLEKKIVEMGAEFTIQLDGISTRVSKTETRISGTEQSITKQESEIKQTADSISSEVQRATTAEGELSTKIIQNADSIKSKVSKDNIISEINQSAEEVKIQAEKINLTGAVSISSLDNSLKESINNTVKSTEVQYAQGNNSTIAPSSGWSTTAPSYSPYKYIWQRTATTYNDGSTSTSSATCISGVNGKNGTGVSSIIPLYYASDSSTAPTIDNSTPIYTDTNVGHWTTKQPTFDKSYKYIYTCSKITYSNNVVEFSTVSQDNVLSSIVQWCKANDTTKIDGASIYTGSVAAEQIDVNDLFAQTIQATGKIVGAEFNTGNGTFTVDKNGKLITKNIQILGGSLDVTVDSSSKNIISIKFTNSSGTVFETKMTAVGLSTYKNGVANASINGLFGTLTGTSIKRNGQEVVCTGDGSISSLQSASTYMEVATTGGAKGITWWSSDSRLKENIEDTDINNALEIVDKIKHHKFDWKDQSIKSVKLGYLAHELQEIDEDMVFAVKQPEGSEYDDLLQIDETKVIPYLSKAIQELHEVVKEQQKEIDLLKTMVEK